jgi:RNA polymerase sigma factor (sigma-70 family)
MDAIAPITGHRLAVPRGLARLRSDEALGERFRDGDESAFAALYKRHRTSVLAICMGVLGSRQDAEDAAQEAFTSLAVALRDSPPRDLRPWLARVARNSAIDLARRRRSHPVFDEPQPEPVTSGDAITDELESVLAGIRQLPEAQRTALLVRELGGHCYQEIADLLELDTGAVRGLIAREDRAAGLSRGHRAAVRDRACGDGRRARRPPAPRDRPPAHSRVRLVPGLPPGDAIRRQGAASARSGAYGRGWPAVAPCSGWRPREHSPKAP